MNPEDRFFDDLTGAPFKIEDLLMQEAVSLCKCSPIKDEPKFPSGSTSLLTEQSIEGVGPAHCIIKEWPSAQSPSAWGERNRGVLLEETIQPGIWSTLGNRNKDYHHLRRRIRHSQLPTIRMNDNGNEEAYRFIIEKLLERLNAIAFVFFHFHWLKPENSDHPDFSNAMNTLLSFDVKPESASEDTRLPIRNDVVIHIRRETPLPLLKSLPGTLIAANMCMVNAKSTAHAEHIFKSSFTSCNMNIETVDQAMTLSVLMSMKSEGLSNAEIHGFLSKESPKQWPLIATSHFAQFVYELNVSTSSCGVFSTLWGFHRVAFLEYRPQDTNVLYVSKNLSAQFTGEEHRINLSSNLAIVKEFFFFVVLSILYTYGDRIIPPSLREQAFCAYFRGLKKKN